MKKMLCNKKYSGILWAIVIASLFVTISFGVIKFLNGIPWFIFSSILRFVFGFIILFAVKKLYDKPIKEVLSIKGSKIALVAGSGFVVYFFYYLLVWFSGIKSITGLTIGLLISRFFLQQIATGFYEELNYRVLILEGYFYGAQNIKNKLIYGFVSFLLFGAVHVINGWSTYRFFQTGVIGFAFAVMYLKSRNILLPMLLHFLYDIFANLTDYIEWNNSTLFVNMNSIFDIMLIIMFVISLIMLLKKEKNDKDNVVLT
ncbi:MAG: type II CAAX prenyl endopeptidase Rce1 family protein [Hominimerdicola sp.]